MKPLRNLTRKTANSSSVKTTEIVDELSFIEKIKSYTADELYDLGCTKEEVSYIMNYDYNQDLVNLSKKDATELEKIGYSNKQIEKIKAYDGTTDAIDYAQANSLSNATLSLSYMPYSSSSTSTFGIWWTYEWSSIPIFQGTDIVAFNWVASTKSSSVISMSYSSVPTAYTNYCYTDNTYYQTVDLQPTYNIGNLYVNIPMSKNVGSLQLYARSGGGFISLKTQSGSSNLYSMQILSAYGHSTITLAPSVSFDTSGVSVGISFAFSMQDLSRSVHTYKYDGTLIN